MADWTPRPEVYAELMVGYPIRSSLNPTRQRIAKRRKVTASLTWNENKDTCPAANIPDTMLYFGDSPVSRANCDGDTVARVGKLFNMLY
jgi:hypothetical protein